MTEPVTNPPITVVDLIYDELLVENPGNQFLQERIAERARARQQAAAAPDHHHA